MLNVKKLLTKILDLHRDSGWLWTTNGQFRYRKIGNIVYLRAYGQVSITITSSGTVLGNLPAGYRPSEQHSFVLTPMSGDAVITCYVGTDGVITGYSRISTAYWNGNTSFISEN